MTDKTRDRTHPFTIELIRKALDLGYDLNWIAGVCGVAYSTVSRWRATGKGDRVKVLKLEKLIGAVDLSAEDTAKALQAEYVKKGGSFYITDVSLFNLVGTAVDGPYFIDDLKKLLYQFGYFFLLTRKNAEIIYCMLSHTALKSVTSEEIKFKSTQKGDLV